MKTKLYFGVLALLWLLSSCDIESTRPEHSYARLVIDNHEYIDFGYELDSITRVAIGEELKK